MDKKIGIVTRINNKYLYVWNVDLGIKEVKFLREGSHINVQVVFNFLLKKIK